MLVLSLSCPICDAKLRARYVDPELQKVFDRWATAGNAYVVDHEEWVSGANYPSKEDQKVGRNHFFVLPCCNKPVDIVAACTHFPSPGEVYEGWIPNNEKWLELVDA